MSKELVNWDKQLAVHEQANRSLRDKEPVLKRTMAVLTAWFGKQMYDDSDHEAFMRESSFRLNGVHLATFYIPDADELKDAESYRPIADDLARELDGIKSPLAVFIIATPKAAELRHIDRLPQGILEYRFARHAQPSFVYKIIFGYGFSNPTHKDCGPFTEEEIRSRQLGGVFVPFNGDYPSVAGRRLTEIIGRILGYDLPGEKFPNYTPDEVEKIAWNARRENFNAFSVKEGAIPKYPIVDGRPVFPF